jgi:DNA polymerase elongation subunit (family B)
MQTNGAFYDKYFDTLFRRLSLVCELSDDEKEKIRTNIMKKVKPIELVVQNNYKDSFMETSSEEILNFYYDKVPNISGYGVLFNHKPNIPGRVLDFLLKERKVKKKLMLKHANDEDKTMHNKYDVEQKVIKVLANAYYGAFGQSSFHFYNPYLGPSVTYTGQHIILSAIMGFEAFMSDNFFFFNFDEMIKYIDNIVTEEDLQLTTLDTPVGVEDVYKRLISKCRFDLNEEQEMVLGGIIDVLPYSQLERLFLKNNLFYMLDNSTEVQELMGAVYSEDFMNPDEPPEAIKEEMENLNAYFEYFVSYPYQWDNKHEVVPNLKRKTVLISDTDSTFLNLDPAVQWYKKQFEVELDRIGRIAVCNIMVFAITKFVEKVFYQLTTNLNIKEEMRSKINMKSEFNFSRIILTKNKKQYAGQIVLQEGNLLKKPKFAVVGLSIKKVGTPKIARQKFHDILEKDMLLAEKIDPLVPFKKFLEFEKEINDSLQNGETNFLKPARFSSEKAYKEPFSQMQVRGVRLWNALYPDKPIPNFSSVKLIKLKDIPRDQLADVAGDEIAEGVERFITDSRAFLMDRAEKIRDADDRDKAIKKAENFEDFGVICIPKELDNFPAELVPLVDVNTIINDNMKNGNILLESIGFKVMKSLKFEVVSNILEL